MAEPPRTRTGKTRRRWSARARPGWPWPPSSTSTATRSRSTSATRPRAGCCASACPTRSSRSGSSTAASRCSSEEGIEFACGVDVGRDVAADELRARHDAVVVAIGSRVHRDLDVPGRELDGVHFAMEYLYQRNRYVARQRGPPGAGARAERADQRRAAGAWWWWAAATPAWTASPTRCARAPRTCCCSTSTRRCPATGRPASTPWPLPPKRTPTTYALDEGGERRFGTQVTELVGRGRPRAGRSRAGASRAPPRATCSRSPAATSTSRPTWC